LLIQQLDSGDHWAHHRFSRALAYNILAWSTVAPPVSEPGNEKLALDYAEKAVQFAPADGDFWNVLGVAHYGAGNWRAAVSALSKAMQLSQGGRSEDWFFLAMAHWHLGDKRVSRSWYNKAVEWMKQNQPHNEELCRFRSEAAPLLGVNEK
jgi:Tfp pilus assembly protein PilF